MIGILFEFADPNCQVIVLLEYNSLHKLFLFLQPNLQIIVKFINLAIDLVLEFVKIFLDGCEPSLYIFPILLCILKMIFELLGQFGEDTLHLTILLSDNLHNFFDLCIYIVTQLARSIC